MLARLISPPWSAGAILVFALCFGIGRAAEPTAAQVQEIYASVQRQVRWFTLAALIAIATTSVFLIRSSQRLFSQLASLSNQRKEGERKPSNGPGMALECPCDGPGNPTKLLRNCRQRRRRFS